MQRQHNHGGAFIGNRLNMMLQVCVSTQSSSLHVFYMCKICASMGEKGTEALHAHFNKLYRTYGCMANKVERLKCIMKEHYFLSVRSNINGLRPQARAED